MRAKVCARKNKPANQNQYFALYQGTTVVVSAFG
jgi:hypothetical protein